MKKIKTLKDVIADFKKKCKHDSHHVRIESQTNCNGPGEGSYHFCTICEQIVDWSAKKKRYVTYEG